MKNKSIKWISLILLYLITSLIFFLVFQAEDARNGTEEPLSTSIPKALFMGLCVFGYDIYLYLRKFFIRNNNETKIE
ncbi:MAG: hypothetical protein ITF99_01120 [Chryseobacterium sp.]|nr:hypothetical protein [Chryseobacterium sp.]